MALSCCGFPSPSTSIFSAAPSSAAASRSKVVTFSTWYSPRRFTELLSPSGKLWNMKMKTLPQKAGSRALDRRRRSSLQVRRMTSCFCLKCFAVMRSRRDSRKSKTLRQPAMVWLSSSSSTSQNRSAGSHSSLSERNDKMSKRFQTLAKAGDSMGVVACRARSPVSRREARRRGAGQT